MPKLGALIFFLVLISTGMAESASAPPQPVATSQDLRGTSSVPLVVKVLSTPTGDKEAADVARAAKDTVPYNHWLLFLTAALSFAALLQWGAMLWQGRILRQTVLAAQDGDRAYVFPGSPDTSAFFPMGHHAMYPGNPEVPSPEVAMTFANLGRTTCVIKAVRAEILIGDALPAKPTFIYSEIRTHNLISHIDQETDPVRFSLNRRLSVEEIDEIGVGTTPFHVFGYVEYADIFGLLNTKGFCFRVSFTHSTQWGRQEFVRTAGGAVYNYRTRKRASAETAL